MSFVYRQFLLFQHWIKADAKKFFLDSGLAASTIFSIADSQ
jgi:hypothetical protein